MELSASDQAMKLFTIAPATAEFPRNDHASIIELKNGDLRIAYIEFCGDDRTAGHDHAPSRIVSMVSSDGGLTWLNKSVLASTNRGDVNVYHPCLLRMKDGSILLFYLRYHQLHEGMPLIVSSHLTRSGDEGATFSPAVEAEALRGFSDCNGLIRISSGRIILACGQSLGDWCGTTTNGEASDHCIAFCCYSDDEGLTWTRSENYVDLPRRGAMEPHIAELRDGRLLMTMRTELGAIFRAYSADAGVTWSRPQTTGLKAPESLPCLRRVPATGDLVLVWNDSEFDPQFDHSGKRTPLSIAISQDEGETWRKIADIETDPGWEFTNPGCHFFGKDSLLVTYVASKMDNPHPPGRLGRSRMSLKAALFSLDALRANACTENA